MVLCAIILKEEDLLDEVLHQLKLSEVHNITVISSVCKVTEYVNHNKNHDVHIFGTFRHLVDYFSDNSQVILSVAQNDKINIVKDNIKNILTENQYIFFTMPIDNIQGKIE